MDELTYNWKDRKRILGMPISFTKYAMSDDRIFVETGLFNIRAEEILLYRVQDISLRLPLTQRIFGVGTVVLQSSDRTQPMLELKNIKQPRRVKELVHQQVEQMKLARRMHVGEVLDDCAHESDADFLL